MFGFLRSVKEEVVQWEAVDRAMDMEGDGGVSAELDRYKSVPAWP